MSANGYLTQSELRPLCGGYYAAPGPAAAWNAMAAEIKAATGTIIRVNGPDSAYRSFARQVYWKDYWCGQGACQNAATPGTSNHGLGWAFDVPSYVSALMDRYGSQYGFRRVCSDAPWESWHWKWCGGWTGKDPGPSGAGTPPKYPTLKKGSRNKSAVKRAQKHLRRWNLGLTRPDADGSFGDTTKKAVVEFQAVHGLGADGVIGKNTWKRLRQKDHFLDDERRTINLIRWARHTPASGEKEIRQLKRWRAFCALRARSIAHTAKDSGWDDLHRRERFKTLRNLAGDLFKTTHLPK